MQVKKQQQLESRHETKDWVKIGKGVWQGSILSPCSFNFYAEYVMLNARLGESPSGLKIARRNTNNLRYADETALMAEHKEELKSLLTKVKEKGEKAAWASQFIQTEIQEYVWDWY